MLQILPVKTDEDRDAARAFVKEYTASLGFDLRFQQFDEEPAGMPGDDAIPDIFATMILFTPMVQSLHNTLATTGRNR